MKNIGIRIYSNTISYLYGGVAQLAERKVFRKKTSLRSNVQFIPPPPMSKTCTKCGTSNLSEEFFDKTERGYLYSYCKECRRKQNLLARRKRYQRPFVKNNKCILAKSRLIRRAMPYEAWICLVPKVREAKEKGLFESWLGK